MASLLFLISIVSVKLILKEGRQDKVALCVELLMVLKKNPSNIILVFLVRRLRL